MGLKSDDPEEDSPANVLLIGLVVAVVLSRVACVVVRSDQKSRTPDQSTLKKNA